MSNGQESNLPPVIPAASRDGSSGLPDVIPAAPRSGTDIPPVIEAESRPSTGMPSQIPAGSREPRVVTQPLREVSDYTEEDFGMPQEELMARLDTIRELDIHAADATSQADAVLEDLSPRALSYLLTTSLEEGDDILPAADQALGGWWASEDVTDEQMAEAFQSGIIRDERTLAYYQGEPSWRDYERGNAKITGGSIESGFTYEWIPSRMINAQAERFSQENMEEDLEIATSWYNSNIENIAPFYALQRAVGDQLDDIMARHAGMSVDQWRGLEGEAREEAGVEALEALQANGEDWEKEFVLQNATPESPLAILTSSVLPKYEAAFDRHRLLLNSMDDNVILAERRQRTLQVQTALAGRARRAFDTDRGVVLWKNMWLETRIGASYASGGGGGGIGDFGPGSGAVFRIGEWSGDLEELKDVYVPPWEVMSRRDMDELFGGGGAYGARRRTSREGMNLDWERLLADEEYYDRLLSEAAGNYSPEAIQRIIRHRKAIGAFEAFEAGHYGSLVIEDEHHGVPLLQRDDSAYRTLENRKAGNAAALLWAREVVFYEQVLAYRQRGVARDLEAMGAHAGVDAEAMASISLSRRLYATGMDQQLAFDYGPTFDAIKTHQMDLISHFYGFSGPDASNPIIGAYAAMDEVTAGEFAATFTLPEWAEAGEGDTGNLQYSIVTRDDVLDSDRRSRTIGAPPPSWQRMKGDDGYIAGLAEERARAIINEDLIQGRGLLFVESISEEERARRAEESGLPFLYQIFVPAGWDGTTTYSRDPLGRTAETFESWSVLDWTMQVFNGVNAYGGALGTQAWDLGVFDSMSHMIVDDRGDFNWGLLGDEMLVGGVATRRHTVRRHDTLESIAEEYFGTEHSVSAQMWISNQERELGVESDAVLGGGGGYQGKELIVLVTGLDIANQFGRVGLGMDLRGRENELWLEMGERRMDFAIDQYLDLAEWGGNSGSWGWGWDGEESDWGLSTEDQTAILGIPAVLGGTALDIVGPEPLTGSLIIAGKSMRVWNAFAIRNQTRSVIRILESATQEGMTYDQIVARLRQASPGADHYYQLRVASGIGVDENVAIQLRALGDELEAQQAALGLARRELDDLTIASEKAAAEARIATIEEDILRMELQQAHALRDMLTGQLQALRRRGAEGALARYNREMEAAETLAGRERTAQKQVDSLENSAEWTAHLDRVEDLNAAALTASREEQAAARRLGEARDRRGAVLHALDVEKREVADQISFLKKDHEEGLLAIDQDFARQIDGITPPSRMRQQRSRGENATAFRERQRARQREIRKLEDARRKARREATDSYRARREELVTVERRLREQLRGLRSKEIGTWGNLPQELRRIADELYNADLAYSTAKTANKEARTAAMEYGKKTRAKAVFPKRAGIELQMTRLQNKLQRATKARALAEGAAWSRVVAHAPGITMGVTAVKDGKRRLAGGAAEILEETVARVKKSALEADEAVASAQQAYRDHATSRKTNRSTVAEADKAMDDLIAGRDREARLQANVNGLEDQLDQWRNIALKMAKELEEGNQVLKTLSDDSPRFFDILAKATTKVERVGVFKTGRRTIDPKRLRASLDEKFGAEAVDHFIQTELGRPLQNVLNSTKEVSISAERVSQIQQLQEGLLRSREAVHRNAEAIATVRAIAQSKGDIDMMRVAMSSSTSPRRVGNFFLGVLGFRPDFWPHLWRRESRRWNPIKNRMGATSDELYQLMKAADFEAAMLNEDMALIARAAHGGHGIVTGGMSGTLMETLVRSRRAANSKSAIELYFKLVDGDVSVRQLRGSAPITAAETALRDELREIIPDAKTRQLLRDKPDETLAAIRQQEEGAGFVSPFERTVSPTVTVEDATTFLKKDEELRALRENTAAAAERIDIIRGLEQELRDFQTELAEVRARLPQEERIAARTLGRTQLETEARIVEVARQELAEVIATQNVIVTRINQLTAQIRREATQLQRQADLLEQQWTSLSPFQQTPLEAVWNHMNAARAADRAGDTVQKNNNIFYAAQNSGLFDPKRLEQVRVRKDLGDLSFTPQELDQLTAEWRRIDGLKNDPSRIRERARHLLRDLDDPAHPYRNEFATLDAVNTAHATRADDIDQRIAAAERRMARMEAENLPPDFRANLAIRAEVDRLQEQINYAEKGLTKLRQDIAQINEMRATQTERITTKASDSVQDFIAAQRAHDEAGIDWQAAFYGNDDVALAAAEARLNETARGMELPERQRSLFAVEEGGQWIPNYSESNPLVKELRRLDDQRLDLVAEYERQASRLRDLRDEHTAVFNSTEQLGPVGTTKHERLRNRERALQGDISRVQQKLEEQSALPSIEEIETFMQTTEEYAAFSAAWKKRIEAEVELESILEGLSRSQGEAELRQLMLQNTVTENVARLEALFERAFPSSPLQATKEAERLLEQEGTFQTLLDLLGASAKESDLDFLAVAVETIKEARDSFKQSKRLATPRQLLARARAYADLTAEPSWRKAIEAANNAGLQAAHFHARYIERLLEAESEFLRINNAFQAAREAHSARRLRIQRGEEYLPLENRQYDRLITKKNVPIDVGGPGTRGGVFSAPRTSVSNIGNEVAWDAAVHQWRTTDLAGLNARITATAESGAPLRVGLKLQGVSESFVGVSRMWVPRSRLLTDIEQIDLLRAAKDGIENRNVYSFETFADYMKGRTHGILKETSAGTVLEREHSIAMGAYNVMRASIMKRTLDRMTRMMGGVLTPKQAEGINTLMGAEKGIRSIDPADWHHVIEGLNKLGTPITQTHIRTGMTGGLGETTARMVAAGETAGGQPIFIRRDMLDAFESIFNDATKRSDRFFRTDITEGTALATAMKKSNSFYNAWRMSVTSGYILPRPGYWMNNIVGDFAQMWFTVGIDKSAKVSFNNLPNNIPILGRHVSDWVSTMAHWGGTKNKALGTILNAFFNPHLTKVWNRMPGSVVFRGGQTVSYEQLYRWAVQDGILDSIIQEEFLQVINRTMSGGVEKAYQSIFITAKNWQEDVLMFADFAQKRQRMGLYLELLSEGYTRAEARRLTLEALYDWRHGLSQMEAALIVKFSGFWRFWKNMLKQSARVWTQPLTKPDLTLRQMLGREATLAPGQQMRQVLYAKEKIPELLANENEATVAFQQGQEEVRLQAKYFLEPYLYDYLFYGVEELDENQRRWMASNLEGPFGLGPDTVVPGRSRYPDPNSPHYDRQYAATHAYWVGPKPGVTEGMAMWATMGAWIFSVGVAADHAMNGDDVQAPPLADDWTTQFLLKPMIGLSTGPATWIIEGVGAELGQEVPYSSFGRFEHSGGTASLNAGEAWLLMWLGDDSVMPYTTARDEDPEADKMGKYVTDSRWSAFAIRNIPGLMQIAPLINQSYYQNPDWQQGTWEGFVTSMQQTGTLPWRRRFTDPRMILTQRQWTISQSMQARVEGLETERARVFDPIEAAANEEVHEQKLEELNNPTPLPTSTYAPQMPPPAGELGEETQEVGSPAEQLREYVPVMPPPAED